MNTILYHSAGRYSAPLLAEFMGITAQRKLEIKVDNLIRWGLATKVPTPGKEINPRSSLVKYFSRLKQLELLKIGGVSVPEFSVDPNVGWPMLGRNEGRKRKSTRGRGITYYPESKFPMPKHSFYTHFYPKRRQFRVHVIADATRTRELVPNLDNEKFLDQPIWNFHTGFTYRQPTGSRATGIIPQAKLALVALGLDFGAVDIIVYQGKAYVLEVNTAPGLGPLTLSWYARHLAPLIGLDPTTLPGLKEAS